MKKIAICLTGELRSVYYSLYELKNFLQNYFFNFNIDYFIYTSNTNNSLWNSNYKKLYNLLSYNISEEKIQFINNILEPKIFYINHTNELFINYLSKFLTIDKINEFLTYNYGLFQFFYKQECVKYKKQYEKDNNIKYDITLISRPDLIFQSSETKKIYENSDFLTNNTIYIPYRRGEWDSDLFYIGKSEYINYLFENYIDILINLYNKYKNNCAEYLNFHIMKEKNINVKSAESNGLTFAVIKEELLHICTKKFNSLFEKYRYIMEMYYYFDHQILDELSIKISNKEYKEILYNIVKGDKYNIFDHNKEEVKEKVLWYIKNGY